jgi:hypothetical protein
MASPIEILNVAYAFGGGFIGYMIYVRINDEIRVLRFLNENTTLCCEEAGIRSTLDGLNDIECGIYTIETIDNLPRVMHDDDGSSLLLDNDDDDNDSDDDDDDNDSDNDDDNDSDNDDDDDDNSDNDDDFVDDGTLNVRNLRGCHLVSITSRSSDNSERMNITYYNPHMRCHSAFEIVIYNRHNGYYPHRICASYLSENTNGEIREDWQDL